MSATAEAKKITLLSSDDQEFQVEEAIAMEFGIVKNLYDKSPNASQEAILLRNVTAKGLSDLIEYCKSHLAFRALGATEDQVRTHDEEFVKARDIECLKELTLAAQCLDVKDLDMFIGALADRIKNKSLRYVRSLFGIDNDFTPEEDAEYRAKNEWAFEGIDPDDD